MSTVQDLADRRDQLKRELSEVEREIKARHGEVDGVEREHNPPPDPQPDPKVDPETGKAVEDVRPEDDDSEYNSWSNEELQSELTERGLSKSGNKSEMVARLEADDESK